MTETARWKISEENRRLLELEYDRKRFPSPRTKKRLADALDVDTRGRFVRFDGRYEHEVLPYEGTRYSVIYFQLEPEWSVDPSSCEI